MNSGGASSPATIYAAFTVPGNARNFITFTALVLTSKWLCFVQLMVAANLVGSKYGQCKAAEGDGGHSSSI